MRIYMNGTISNGEAAHFLPSDIFFQTKDCEENDAPSTDCLMLSGLECECHTNGNEWSCRWKGVTAETDEDYGEDFTKEDILRMIRERQMFLGNMSGYVDFDDSAEPVCVKVDSIVIVDGERGTELEPELLKEPIEFIA